MKKILLFLVLFLNLFPLGFNFEKGKMLFPGSLYGQYQGVEGECINGYMTCDCDGWVTSLDCSDPVDYTCMCIDPVIITPPPDFTCPICGQDPCVCGYYDPCSYGSPDYSDCACLGINCDYGGCDPSSPYYDECTCLGMNCDDGGGDGSSGDDPTDPPDNDTGGDQYYFDTTMLTPEEKNLFDSTIIDLESNCFFKSMLELLQSDTITIDVNNGIQGQAAYHASTNTVFFQTVDEIIGYNAASELFHAFQDTYYGSYMEDLESELTLNGIYGSGFSNIEFEEKFAHRVAGLVHNHSYTPIESMEGVDVWIYNLMADNNNIFPSTFSQAQSNVYISYLQTFQQWNANAGDDYLPYAAPIDYEGIPQYPAALIEILNNSDCYED